MCVTCMRGVWEDVWVCGRMWVCDMCIRGVWEDVGGRFWVRHVYVHMQAHER